LEATGYVGRTSGVESTLAASVLASATGFPITTTEHLASSACYGAVELTRHTGSVWVASGVVGASGTYQVAGNKTVSGTIQYVGIVATSGTFDSGSINVMYEGFS